VRDAAALRAEASYIAMYGHPPPPTAACMQLPPPPRGGDPTLPHAVAARPPPHRLTALLADVLPPPAAAWGFYVGGGRRDEVLTINNYRRSLLHLAIHAQNLLAALLFVELGCTPDGTGTFTAVVGDDMHGTQTMRCSELAAHMRGAKAGEVATAIDTVVMERTAPADTRRRTRAAAASAAAAVAASSAPPAKRRRP